MPRGSCSATHYQCAGRMPAPKVFHQSTYNRGYVLPTGCRTESRWPRTRRLLHLLEGSCTTPKVLRAGQRYQKTLLSERHHEKRSEVILMKMRLTTAGKTYMPDRRNQRPCASPKGRASNRAKIQGNWHRCRNAVQRAVLEKGVSVPSFCPLLGQNEGLHRPGTQKRRSDLLGDSEAHTQKQGHKLCSRQRRCQSVQHSH